VSEITDAIGVPHRLFRKAVQQGHSERRSESYSLPYVEPLSEASTPLAVFVNSLLVSVKSRADSNYNEMIIGSWLLEE